jgi:hypothetical protein
MDIVDGASLVLSSFAELCIRQQLPSARRFSQALAGGACDAAVLALRPASQGISTS